MSYKKNSTVIIEKETDVFSPAFIKVLHQTTKKTFITKELLIKHKAILATNHKISREKEISEEENKKKIVKEKIEKKSSLLAFPMYPSENEMTWHCINYETYPSEPRFFTATSDKKIGRPKAKLGLLGLDTFDQNSEKIFLTEGIWDMLCLDVMGYSALGLPGVNNLNESWLQYFKNKVVYIIFDNDNPGKEYAKKHSKKIYEVAKEVYIIEIPEEDGIKDISDLYIKNVKKAIKVFNKLIEQANKIEITIKDRITEILRMRGNGDQKAEVIANMIVVDLKNDDGSIASYNYGQEWLLITGGKHILTDQFITIFLREKYGYYNTILWNDIKEKLYEISLNNKIELHFETCFKNNKIYIGFKDNGILVINKDEITIKSQGCDNIFIQSNIEMPKDFNIDEINKEAINMNSILDNFKFINSEQSKLLTEIWFYNLFFDPVVKPLLTIVGAVGSGKTFLMKILKGILFGFNNYLPNTIPEEDHSFILILKNNKFIFLDEVKNIKNDQILNKFRSVVTGEEMIFRPKYNRENIKFKPKNFLILAADDPRAMQKYDIAQRACIIIMDKMEKIKISESILIKEFEEKRKKIWHGIIKALQTILINLNKKDNIPLQNYCRLHDLANFAWNAFPKNKKEILKLFDNMALEQEKFSAEQDPILDLLEDELTEKGQSEYTTKQLHNSLYPRSKEKGINMPKSISGFGQWLHYRDSILKDKFGMIKKKDRSKIWIYCFREDNNNEQ